MPKQNYRLDEPRYRPATGRGRTRGQEEGRDYFPSRHESRGVLRSGTGFDWKERGSQDSNLRGKNRPSKNRTEIGGQGSHRHGQGAPTTRKTKRLAQGSR